MLWISFVIFSLRPSDRITTLTYVLMDNFFPCLIKTRVDVTRKREVMTEKKENLAIPLFYLTQLLIVI